MGYILVTGASGFIGKNLLTYIGEKHPKTKDKILILGSSGSSEYPVIPHKGYCFSSGDFTRRGFHEIEAVIHLGAFTPKSAAEKNLHAKNYANIVNTNHLLHNLPNKPAKFIYISSLDVYQPTADAITEQTPTIPADFYGTCKLFCEKLVMNWCRQNKVIPQVLRLGHIYGKGEEAYEKLIPLVMRKVINDNRPVIYTAGHEKRSYLHAQDCVRAIWEALQFSEFIGPVNIASSHCYSIKEIVQKIIDISGKDLRIRILNKRIAHRDIFYDNQKMRRHFSEEQIDLVSGLTQEYKTYDERPEAIA